MEVKENKKSRKVSEKKSKLLKELVHLIEKSSTILVSSATNLPSAQLQKTRKILSGKATIKAVKKNIGIKALESAKKENILELEKFIESNSLVLFSQLDSFELATFLAENRFPAKAKVGQVASADIAVEAGPTDLLPGPIISELSAVGIKAGVEGGKLAVKERCVLVKKGEKIKKAVAEVLTKLEITPFMVGLEPLASYDSKTKKVYVEIKIDKEATLEELKNCYVDAQKLALSIEYPCAETISALISKVELEAKALEAVLTQQNSQVQQNQAQ